MIEHYTRYRDVQVEFEGATGTVAFDRFGRRRNYTLDVLEHRLDNEMYKVLSTVRHIIMAFGIMSRLHPSRAIKLP